MKLTDQIRSDWEAAKKLRLALVADDPNPEHSRLDRMDGLK